jgi:hypothetical protein
MGKSGKIRQAVNTNKDRDLVIKIISGAMIPALATVIFNLLNYFIDSYEKPACNNSLSELSSSVFDIAPGCAFAIVGLCMNVRDVALILRFLVCIIFLILLILAGDMLFLVMKDQILKDHRIHLILTVDLLSFIGLSWAIAEAS